MPKIIKTAKYAGFCFGVKRAVDTVFAYAASRPDAAIYTVGELIHNPTVISRLSEMGVVTVKENEVDRMLEQAPPRSVFVIRTHGVPRLVKEKLIRFTKAHPEAEILDMTCPFVAKIYQIMEENTGEDTYTLLLGDARHPEIIGISSYIKGAYRIYANFDEIKSSLDCGEFHNFESKQIFLFFDNPTNDASFVKLK